MKVVVNVDFFKIFIQYQTHDYFISSASQKQFFNFCSKSSKLVSRYFIKLWLLHPYNAKNIDYIVSNIKMVSMKKSIIWYREDCININFFMK